MVHLPTGTVCRMVIGLLKDADGGKFYNHTLGVPIIFSVTGHVDVSGEQATMVKQRIMDLFQSFKRLYPHTELMLLTGLAEGSDRIAADAAISCDVHVGPVLPSGPETYAESFRGMGYNGDVQASKDDFRRYLDNELTYSPCILPASGSETDSYRNLGAYLISNSHVVIAVWDGNTYAEGNGGTYDTMRMAYEGIDNDLHAVAQPMSPDSRFRNETAARYLNVAEDCLIYWIQVERTLDQSVLNSRGFHKGPGYCDATGFIPPQMMSEEVAKYQQYKHSWIHSLTSEDKDDRIKAMRKAGVPETNLNSSLFIHLGKDCIDVSTYRTLPHFYDQLFCSVDEFNKDAGSNGTDYRPGSPMDPDVIRAKGDWGSRSYMMSDEYLHKGKKKPIPGSADIKEKGLMEPMAMRYSLADGLSNSFQKQSTHTIEWIIFISALTAFAFHLFIMSNTAVYLVATYGILLVIEKALNLWHLNSAEYRKHVEYRCVAETTRVNYYWGLMDINDSAYASCYGFLRNETFWVRSVLLSWSSYFMNDYDMSSVPYDKRRQAVLISWTDNQLSYHIGKKETNRKLFRMYDRMNSAIIVLLVIMSAIMVVGTVFCFDTFNTPIGIYDIHVIGDELIDEGKVEVTLTSLIKLAMIFLTLSATYVMTKKETVAGGTPEQIEANIKVFTLTRIRAMRIRSEAKRSVSKVMNAYSDGPEREAELTRIESDRDRCLMHLVHELGSQCIDENNDWVFNTKAKDVNTLGRQDEVAELAKE